MRTPVFALGVCLAIAATRAQDTLGSRDMVRQADQRIRELQAESDRLAGATRTLLGELRTLELQREIKVQQVKKVDAELAAMAMELESATARVTALESQRIAETPGINERLVELYKRGRGGYLRMLLQSDDVRALGRMSRGVAAVAELDRARFDALRRTMRAQQDAVVDLDRRRSGLTAAQDEARRARQALDLSIAAHNRRLDDLDQKRDLAARYVGELQRAQADLQRRVSALPGTVAAALPLAPFRGALAWPVAGRVLSRFGLGAADRFGTTVVRNGIEIATTPKQNVRAVHGGTVAFSAPFTGFGTLVIVDHGQNDVTLYGHLAEALVAQGARVDRGTIVGRSGRSPAGVDVMYFELRIDGRPVDPVQWLRSSQ